MGDSTAALIQLRTVSFTYKSDGHGIPGWDMGCSPEDVDHVFPELVAHKADGTPFAVRTLYLAPMLLNEVQKRYHKVESQAQSIQAQQQKIEQLDQRLSKLESMLAGGAQK